MEFNNVWLGARIEFYEQLDGPDRKPTNYVGAAVKDDAFAGAALPRPGDRVSVVSLAGGIQSARAYLLNDGGLPFLPVAYIEHYLVPVNQNGEIPSWWWPGFRTPRSHLVFHARVTHEGNLDGMNLAQTLKEQGWTVDDKVSEFSARPM